MRTLNGERLQLLGLTVLTGAGLWLLYWAIVATGWRWLILLPAPILAVGVRHAFRVFMQDHWSQEDNYP